MREENIQFNKLLSLDNLCKLFMEIGISVNSEIDLAKYSYNREALHNSMNLLIRLGFIDYQNNVYLKKLHYEEGDFVKNLIDGMLALYSDEIKDSLSSKIHYSIEDKTIMLFKNSIPLKYAGLFMLLDESGEIVSSDNKWLVVGRGFRNLFVTTKMKHAISIEELKKQLDYESELGEMAEEFVIKIETEKLLSKKIYKSPIRISLIDVTAGFDILSYGENEDEEKYIEVKSCGTDYMFHFTKNEIQTSKKYGDSYWLYLFNRLTMSITEIQNPYKLLFEENSSEWAKEPDGYLIHRI